MLYCLYENLKPYLHTIFLLLLFCSPLHAEEHSPQDIVKEWIKYYGVDQSKASELTTLRLRDGRTKEVWAEETSIPLKQIGYKHLGGKVLAETKKKGRTEVAVALRSTIDSIAGKSEQTEIYILVLKDGKWLIDEVIVRDEVELEELEERGCFYKSNLRYKRRRYAMKKFDRVLVTLLVVGIWALVFTFVFSTKPYKKHVILFPMMILKDTRGIFGEIEILRSLVMVILSLEK